MKKISAEIVADSISPQGHRITSYILTYPRFIHAELMTHRMFSRNSASSRAIPFEKMVKMVKEDPFIPIAWQKDHKGMQGNEYFDQIGAETCEIDWLTTRNFAIQQAKILNQSGGVTKQLCNRLFEPFMWHTVLVTATEYDNFFELRCPKYYAEGTNKHYKSWKDLVIDFPECENYSKLNRLKVNESQAEIHIQALAESMWDAKNESTPKILRAGEWHIPFGDNIMMSILDQQDFSIKFPNLNSLNDLKIRIATARCARLSYMTFDGEIDYEKDIKLHDQLLENKHMSPTEHVARCMNEYEFHNFTKGFPSKDGVGNFIQTGWCNNFRGWISYRYLVEHE